MKDVSSVTSDQILDVPVTEPEQLFSGAQDLARREFHALAALWHPDRSDDPRATEVFQHVSAIYRVAQGRLSAGSWVEPGKLTLQADDGRTFNVRFLKKRPFELGTVYVGRTVVAWVLEPGNDDLLAGATRMISGFRYADNGMRKEFERYLPRVKKNFRTIDGRSVMVVDKTEDLVLLADLLEHEQGALAPVHAAWVLSSLYNLACYFQWAGIAHNDISPLTYFVSPKYHSGALLGGWWYAVPVGKRMLAAPDRTLSNAPVDLMKKKAGDGRVDLELIRAVGREVLGDAAGTSLPGKAPAPLTTWLRFASNGDAVKDYALWGDVLQQSFGPRRFVPLNVGPQDIYGK